MPTLSTLVCELVSPVMILVHLLLSRLVIPATIAVLRLPSPGSLLIRQRLMLGPRNFIEPITLVGALVACGLGPFRYGLGDMFPA